MLKRKMYDHLLEWKGRRHKCLTVKGQRQVGKTYIIEAFGSNEYKDFIKIDFSRSDSAKRVFDGDLDVDTVLKGLRLFTDENIPEGSLIFLDEIQECPRARSALKWFTEDGRFDVIASGSLLGIDMIHTDGADRPLLPTGYEENITMHSMDFEEFLWAAGIQEDIIAEVRSDIRGGTPIHPAAYERLASLFRDFMITGGMPESVRAYADTKDFTESMRILDDIIQTCRNDINRYNTGSDILRTMRCFDSIAPQLADTNKKFMYSRLEDDGKRRSLDKYMNNLLWIKYAGYGNFCYSLDCPELPLKSHMNMDSFKVYLSDTGMLVRMYGDDTARAVYSKDASYNNGAIAENAVAECLMKSGYDPMYYRKTNGQNKMELDFVTVMGGSVCVIEVKSGKKRESPSLRKVASVFDIGRRIVFEDSNIIVDDEGVEHFPLFAAAFIMDLDAETPKRNRRI